MKVYQFYQVMLTLGNLSDDILLNQLNVAANKKIAQVFQIAVADVTRLRTTDG